MKKGDIYPCDKDGDIIAPPTEAKREVSLAFYQQEMKAYKKAESRILFQLNNYEEYQIKLIINGNYTVKDMMSLKYGEDTLRRTSIHLTYAGINYLTR